MKKLARLPYQIVIFLQNVMTHVDNIMIKKRINYLFYERKLQLITIDTHSAN